MFASYIFLGVILSAYLSNRTDKPLLGFVLILWLVASPVSRVYIVSIPGLPIDIQANRLLFVFLTTYFLWAILSGTRGNLKSNHKYLFIKYIYAYLTVVILALIYNSTYLPIKSVASVPIEIITFIVVYFIGKRFVSTSLRNALLDAIVIVAVASSFIAIVQVGINEQFFRVSPDEVRRAFGNIYRATGVFQSEYEFGYFQIFSIFILLSRYRNKWLKYPSFVMISISIVLTFHRLDYLIFLTCILFYVFLYTSKSNRVLFAVITVFLIGLSIPGYIILQRTIMKSDAVQQRLLVNTMSGRMHQYEVLLKAIPDNPLGVGGYENEAYEKLMFDNDLSISYIDERGLWSKKPLLAHNGYLAAGIKYGVMGFLLFTAFVVSLIRATYKLIDRSDKTTVLPFFCVMIWTISNMTNSVSNFRVHFVLIMALVCGMYFRGKSNTKQH